MRLRRSAVAVLVVGVGATVLAVAAPGSFASARGQSASPGTDLGAVTVSKTITRTYVENGSSTVIDKRHVTVHVNETHDLRNRQEVAVSWSGAHPTGGIAANLNSSLASQEEYPFVEMMCRGSASAKAPAKEQVSPQTCWTATPIERAQSSPAFAFPPYRIDQYASAADRGPSVGVPTKVPAACTAADNGVNHWVPFVAVSGHDYGYGPNGCAGLPPEATVTDGVEPSNTTYAVTDLNGKGSSDFTITTDESNASLGCSDKVACSLVLIPIMGISCDPAAFGLPAEDQPPTAAVEQQAATMCETNGDYKPGQQSTGLPSSEALAVSGELWWSASNWRNRIEVPLSFAPPDDICAHASTSTPQYVYGSPLMSQAALQWAPSFCTNPKLFNFQDVETSEPEAKNLLAQGSVDAAFQGSPPQIPFVKPVVQAPTALSGFAVVYVIDNAKGVQYFHLRMDARLLAKLLTESYPAAATVQADYPALRNNPLSMASDPEFEALNPGLPTLPHSTESASTIMMLSSDSDTTWALTQYINDDPEARAWLNGKPDPWGMKVNPNYKGIKLPVTNWPLLDTFIPTAYYLQDPCMQQAPIPYLPLVAGPVEDQSIITLDMQFGVSNSQVVCSGAGTPGQTLTALGREASGQRFLLGVTALADAERYDIPTAALQTSAGSSAGTKFTSGAGRTFVAPTDNSLKAGAKSLVWDKSANSWVLPYASLPKTALGRAAYPGTMLLSTDVPTSGLPSTAASDYSKFLSFAAGPGQTPGLGNGQLPPGYLPMTAANGLGTELAYTRSAAIAVAAQKSQVPNKDGQLPDTNKHHRSPSPTPTRTVSPSATTTESSGSQPPTGIPSVTSPSSSTSNSPSTSPSTSPSASPSAGSSSSPSPTAPTVITGVLAASGVESKAMPIAAIVILLSALGLGAVWALGWRGTR